MNENERNNHNETPPESSTNSENYHTSPFENIPSDTRSGTDRTEEKGPATMKPTNEATSEANNQQDTSQQPLNSPLPIPAPPQRTFLKDFNKYVLYTLVGGLIISALISVVAVLIGEFNSTLTKALGTTGSMVAHAIVALLLVSISSKGQGNGLVLNTLLSITVASFITSLFGIWDILEGRILGDLYLLYLYTFGAVVWIQLHLKIQEYVPDKLVRFATYAAIGLTVLFYILLIPTIFTHYPDKLPEFHYRGMAATIILLATASILTIVFHRIYIFKHPETKSQASTNTGWDVIIALVVLFLGLPVIIGLIASLSYSRDRALTEEYSYTTTSSTTPTPTPRTITSTNCADLPAFQDPKVLRYVSVYTLKTHDPAQKTVTVAYPNNQFTLDPISYGNELSIVDAKCSPLKADALREGDAVQLYLRVGYSNFFNDALVHMQKVE